MNAVAVASVPITGQRASRIITKPTLDELASLRGHDVVLRHTNGSRFDARIVDDWTVEGRHYVQVECCGEPVVLTDDVLRGTEDLVLDVTRFAKVVVF